jgi:lysine/ornithine N-monooxygenase
MYAGRNKINISVLCSHCRKKMSGVQGLTIEEMYHVFYNDPRFADEKHDHSRINSVIVRALLTNHDCTDCVDKMYAFG